MHFALSSAKALAVMAMIDVSRYEPVRRWETHRSYTSRAGVMAQNCLPISKSAPEKRFQFLAALCSVSCICTTRAVMLPAVSSCSMNTAAKLLQAMRSNPLDWKLQQLQTVARQNGIDWRHVGTSHCVFVRADGKNAPRSGPAPYQADLCQEVPGTR